ncbi:MAG: hypothetical protein WBX09_17760 [Terracidiphilus sp.]
MIVHECHDFFRACAELDDAADRLSRIDPPNKILDGNDPVFVLQPIEAAVKVLEVLGITDGGFEVDVRSVRDHVKSLFGGPWFGIFEVRADELARDYKRIREGLFAEIKKHKFVSLPAEGVQYFDQEKLFGDDVFDKFPSARYDIKEAGNAFAFELCTACVFHLMRASEYGLRALAADREVQLATKSGNPFPLDMGTWEDVLSKLGGKLDDVVGWPRSLGKIRTQALEFYTNAIEEARAIKEWRNPTMHTRSDYGHGSADQILTHVERFMVGLSSRISEREKTPLIWTEAQLR